MCSVVSVVHVRKQGGCCGCEGEQLTTNACTDSGSLHTHLQLYTQLYLLLHCIVDGGCAYSCSCLVSVTVLFSLSAQYSVVRSFGLSSRRVYASSGHAMHPRAKGPHTTAVSTTAHRRAVYQLLIRAVRVQSAMLPVLFAARHARSCLGQPFGVAPAEASAPRSALERLPTASPCSLVQTDAG